MFLRALQLHVLCQWGTEAPERYPDHRQANPLNAGRCLHGSHQHCVEGRITHLCSAQSPDGVSAPFPNPLLASHRGIWILGVLNHSVMKSSGNKQKSLEVQHRPTFHMVAGGLLECPTVLAHLKACLCNNCPQSRLFISLMPGKHLKSFRTEWHCKVICSILSEP